jgi:glucosamine 6-phosphate synthetase-like amidotransferase/phosphosugar isomerase protein
MCGICGVRRFSEAPIQRDMIDLLILNNENRGLEATGVALQQADGSVLVCKDNVTPYQFISGQIYKKFMDENFKDDTVTVLGHTRKATQGSPRINNNNHPMFAGETALVHNGTIHNDDQMFKDWKLERKAETDSDILRAVLDAHGFTHKAINNLSRLNGNAAFAAISPEYPGKLLLGRSGNPIELAATQDYLMFSSEKGPLYKAMRPFKRVYGIDMREMTPINYFMIGMKDHSAWLFSDKPVDNTAQDWGADWLEWHQEMRIASHFSPVTYMCHAQYNGTRVKFYDDRPVDVVRCPNKACGEWLQINKVHLADLKKHTCPTCSTRLG